MLLKRVSYFYENDRTDKVGIDLRQFKMLSSLGLSTFTCQRDPHKPTEGENSSLWVVSVIYAIIIRENAVSHIWYKSD